MRKKRRRQLHYTASSLFDGTVLAAYPVRKPAARIVKRDHLKLDPDGVFVERLDAGKDLSDVDNDTRTRFQDIVATRLNIRRALRELIAPTLAEILAEMGAVRSQLDRIERMLREYGKPR